MAIDPLVLQMMNTSHQDNDDRYDLRDQIDALRKDVQYGSGQTTAALAQDALTILKKAYGTLDAHTIQNVEQSQNFCSKVLHLIQDFKQGNVDFLDAKKALHRFKDEV